MHVPELAEFRGENVGNVSKLNHKIIIKCGGVDEKSRVRLSHLAVLCEAKGGDVRIESADSAAAVPLFDRRGSSAAKCAEV
jgi:hypothetical protein